MPCVITSSRDKVICVLTCSLANVSCVLICVRTYVICVLFAITYQRALRAFELTYQRALIFHLPSVLMHSRISVACKIMCLGATMLGFLALYDLHEYVITCQHALPP